MFHVRLFGPLGMLAIVLACASGEPEPTEPSPQPVASPADEAPAAPAPASPAPKGGRKAARDGKQLGALTVEGSARPVTLSGTDLQVGSWSVQLPERPFQTLVVDAAIPSVVVQYDTIDDVGPVDVYTVGDEGSLVRVFHDDGLSSELVAVSGGFEARSRACGETLVDRVSLSGKTPTKTHEKRGRKDPNCGEMVAACPFVDVWVGDRWQTRGEILRNQVGPDASGPQTLKLPAEAVSEGRVRVRLAERKPEVTDLDAVWLVVGGQEFAPVGCLEQELCEVDDRVAVLAPGEEIELSFAVGRAQGIPTLWAHGHYVPLPR